VKRVIYILIGAVLLCILAVGVSAAAPSGYDHDLGDASSGLTLDYLPWDKSYWKAGDGYITFDTNGTSHTLGLHNAQINGTLNNTLYGDITIELHGTSTITNASGYAINAVNGIIITGDGKLTLNARSGIGAERVTITGGDITINADDDAIQCKTDVSLQSCNLKMNADTDIFMYDDCKLTIADSRVIGSSYFLVGSFEIQNSEVTVPYIAQNLTDLDCVIVNDRTITGSEIFDDTLTIAPGVTVTVSETGSLYAADLILEKNAAIINCPKSPTVSTYGVEAADLLLKEGARIENDDQCRIGRHLTLEKGAGIENNGYLYVYGNTVLEEGASLVNDYYFRTGLCLTLGAYASLINNFDLEVHGDLIPEDSAVIRNDSMIKIRRDLTDSEREALFGFGITGTGYILLSVTDESCDHAGNPILLNLSLEEHDDEGLGYTWDYDTMTLTLEDGFLCKDTLTICVDGEITVIVQGDAHVMGDFEDDSYSVAEVTITGGGTLTVDGSIVFDSDSVDSSVTIDAGTTVIANASVNFDNLYLNGALEVRNSRASAGIFIYNKMVVGEDASILVSQEYDDFPAVIFNNILDRPASQLMEGMNADLVPDGRLFYLADKSGNVLYQIGAETEQKLFGGMNFMSILVLWRMMQTYDVNVSIEGLGAVDVVGAEETDGARTAKWSTDVDFTATPADGWELTGILLDGKSAAIDNFRINNIKKDHEITFIFTEIAA